MAAKLGRQDRYATDVEPRLDEIREWARSMTEIQMMEMLNIGKTSWAKYKNQHPELKQAIIDGRTSLVADLKSAMIKRALGYDAEEKKVTTEKFNLTQKQQVMLKALGYNDADFDGMQVVRATVSTKHFAPDVNALNRLLLNYDKDWENDPSILRLKEDEVKVKKLQALDDEKEWEPLDA